MTLNLNQIIISNTLPKFLPALSVILYSSCVPSADRKKSDLEEKPNIIFILTDDQRWDALGYAGNPLIHTPEMDKLASQGVYFRNAFVTTPISAASRASFFTGLHERTHRYTFQVEPVRQEQMQLSYPRLLRENGYFTGFFGKYGVKITKTELDDLFDIHDDYDRNGKFKDYRGFFYKTLQGDTVHLTRYTGAQALEFIDQVPENQSFCLSLSFSAPHAHDPAPEQYYWQKEVDHLYQDMVMPGPDMADDHYFKSLPLPVQQGFNRTRWYWRFDSPEKYQHSVKGYYRMISGIDNEIARIREHLKEKGLDKNTVIILMGDNGYFLGERQLAGKWLMYEHSIKVPLIIYDPRIKKHRDIDDMAVNIDVPATMLDLAGIEIPESWQGKSLLSLARGTETSLNRDTIFIEHLWEMPNIPPSEGVRTAEWKYFRYINDRSVEELYNLKEDPNEIHNLAQSADHADILKSLRLKCDQLIHLYRDPFSALPNELSVVIDKKSVNSAQPIIPKYSWNIPEESKPQKGYQVLVASGRENIDNNIGDVWNSGQIRSNNSTDIIHAGIPLDTASEYYWKVRVWDRDNRLTEYCEAQSLLKK